MEKRIFAKELYIRAVSISAADMPIYGICFALLNCGRSVCL